MSALMKRNEGFTSCVLGHTGVRMDQTRNLSGPWGGIEAAQGLQGARTSCRWDPIALRLDSCSPDDAEQRRQSTPSQIPYCLCIYQRFHSFAVEFSHSILERGAFLMTSSVLAGPMIQTTHPRYEMGASCCIPSTGKGSHQPTSALAKVGMFNQSPGTHLSKRIVCLALILVCV